MAAINQLFSQSESKLAQSVKELTLSGYLPYQGASGYSLTSHPFMHSSGFKAIRPETFKVDLGWDDWDFGVLHVMSVTNLKVLKLPIRLPSDCVRLGQALTVMPRLVSLAITDIPDRDEFLIGLEHIGKGIKSCASTLQELDIEMTNFNHPASWANDERFVEPEDNGFLFRKMFPCPPKEELLALCERHARRDTDPMVDAPLSLTKLRLKHVTLPWYSFGILFNAETIKHLHLPYSMVDEQVWGFLATYAQLDTLIDISYDMLSAEFLNFLGEQPSLKDLSFARPQDQYEATGVTYYGASPHMMLTVSKEAPRLGPDTGAEYPSLENFLYSLEDMTVLKHLALPADMYTITPDSLLFIATYLTGLEHLELGFDYESAVRAHTSPFCDGNYSILTLSSSQELQRMFISCFSCGTSTLKKITFFSLKQPQPLPDYDTAHFRALIASLGDKVPANLKLVRYMPLNQVHRHPYGDIDVYYHRETPVEGNWWICLPSEEREQIFAESRTPRVVSVGKWDWETEARKEAETKAYRTGLERQSFGKSRAN